MSMQKKKAKKRAKVMGKAKFFALIRLTSHLIVDDDLDGDRMHKDVNLQNIKDSDTPKKLNQTQSTADIECFF
jgi:hypothetical protein